MSNWKTGDYADPILPAGDAIFDIMSLKFGETAGGTPFATVMARVSEFQGEFDPEDPFVLDPAGQTAWGTIWLPKENEMVENKKKYLGKQRRVRNFLEVLEYAGAEFLEPDVGTGEEGAITPVDVLTNPENAMQFAGKSFKSNINHTEASEDYPSKAEIMMLKVKRA